MLFLSNSIKYIQNIFSQLYQIVSCYKKKHDTQTHTKWRKKECFIFVILLALQVICWALYEYHCHCGNYYGRKWEKRMCWTWISPTRPRAKEVGTVFLKRWQRNLHNRHYSPQCVCRSVAAVRQPLCSVLISSHQTGRLPEATYKKRSYPAKSCWMKF